MKRFKQKMISLFLFALLFTTLLPTVAYAGNTKSITLSVGESKTLYASGAYRDGQWTSSSRAVSIVSQSRSSCTVRVDEYTSSKTIVHCWYTKPVSTGRYTYYIQDYQDYEITVNKPANVMVSFDANGGWVDIGQHVLQKEYGSGGTYETLPEPWRSGYRFAGWYTKETGGSKVTASSKIWETDTTLYAHWKEISYRVKFDGNGAASGSMSSVRCTGDTTYTLPACEFQREGWRFTGWNTKADGSGSNYTDKAGVYNLTSIDGGTVTLYAQWERYADEPSTPVPPPVPTPESPDNEDSAPQICLELSKSPVILDLEASSSQELVLSASGADLPAEYTFRYERKGSCFSCRWAGDWKGDSHPVSLHGYSEGKGSVIFYILNADGEETLASLEVEVQVVSGTQDTASEKNAQIRANTNHVELNFLRNYYKIVSITAIDDVSERSSSLVTECSNDEIDAFWYSDWNGNTVDLAIYGSRSGAEGTVAVSIVDDHTGETLASTVITVSVE